MGATEDAASGRPARPGGAALIGLDLVQEVERTRARQEEREQERDRAERLLAARQERQARDALAGRLELELDPRLAALLVALDPEESAPPARKERPGDLLEVPLDLAERLLEAPLHRLRQLVAQALELGQRALEILALHRELLEPGLLAGVLLRRERVHLAERLAPALQAGELRPQVLGLLLRERLGLGLLREPA